MAAKKSDHERRDHYAATRALLAHEDEVSDPVYAAALHLVKVEASNDSTVRAHQEALEELVAALDAALKPDAYWGT